MSQQARQCSNIAAEMRRVPTYHPDYIDKSILVHYKHYPNVAAVPDRVDQHIMDRVNKISMFQKYLLTTLCPGQVHGSGQVCQHYDPGNIDWMCHHSLRRQE